MPGRDHTSGGTLGAQSPHFFPELVCRIIEIGNHAGLDWEAFAKDFAKVDMLDDWRPRPSTIQRLWTARLETAVQTAVTKYRSAPPPAPSKVRRDYYDRAFKAANSLSAHLQNEYAQNLLASAFNSHDEALAFLNQLEKLTAVQEINEDLANKRKVDEVLAEQGIQASDPEPYILENFGEAALACFKVAAEELETLERKPRRDAIRFQLACDVLQAIGVPLNLSYAEDDLPKGTLSEIVTAVIEAVGTFSGTPKPGEDYFARAVTNEAIEFVAAQNRYSETCSAFNV